MEDVINSHVHSLYAHDGQNIDKKKKIQFHLFNYLVNYLFLKSLNELEVTVEIWNFKCQMNWWAAFKRDIWVFLNVLTEFSDKYICHYSKRARTCHPATSRVRDQDATTVPARHMRETVSLNLVQFILQWFIKFAEFSEFLFHSGENPLDRVIPMFVDD